MLISHYRLLLELEKLQETQPCTFEVESGLQVIDLGVFFTLAHIKDMTNFVNLIRLMRMKKPQETQHEHRMEPDLLNLTWASTMSGKGIRDTIILRR